MLNIRVLFRPLFQENGFHILLENRHQLVVKVLSYGGFPVDHQRAFSIRRAGRPAWNLRVFGIAVFGKGHHRVKDQLFYVL